LERRLQKTRDNPNISKEVKIKWSEVYTYNSLITDAKKEKSSVSNFSSNEEERQKEITTWRKREALTMTTAFVLINAETGQEESILNQMRRIQFVEEAHLVYGTYDFVVKVSAPTQDVLRNAIANQIRSINGIRSTITLLAVEPGSVK
jgi:DNA-binding Lrp family transcriptional regulator